MQNDETQIWKKKIWRKKQGILLLWGKLAFLHNLQTMQQNAPILKLFSKISLFLKFDFNKIELQVELNISNVEFYAYFTT